MYLFTSSRRHISTVGTALLALTLTSAAFAQPPVAHHTTTQATITPGGTHVSASTTVAAGPVYGAPVPPHHDGLDNSTLLQRGLTIGVAGSGAAYAAGKVSGAARGVVNVGKVGNVPHWGPAVSSLPVVGGAAAGGSVIPTTLGQVPVMGAVVKKVPVVGPVVAGPANPILVGAVAVDNYVIPKYSPCGYTKSSVVAANNDFNTPPRLRSYVNYLAPMPYTHPPIYSPSTLNTDLPADLAYIDGIPAHALGSTVTMPDL